MAASPLILTLKLDAPAFAVLDALRRAHFPAERNFIPAHLTLFHALPGEHEPAIRRALQLACAATPAPALRFERPVFLGRGVALLAESPELEFPLSDIFTYQTARPRRSRKALRAALDALVAEGRIALSDVEDGIEYWIARPTGQ